MWIRVKKLTSAIIQLGQVELHAIAASDYLDASLLRQPLGYLPGFCLSFLFLVIEIGKPVHYEGEMHFGDQLPRLRKRIRID
ncbi:hypothetical protein ACFLXU_00460 [Chloroflexota bacterium]